MAKYVNFPDFVRRVPLSALNRRLVESLIKAGAFDSVDRTVVRCSPFMRLPSIRWWASSASRRKASSICSPIWMIRRTRRHGKRHGERAGCGEWDKEDQLNFEREMLGLCPTIR